MIAQRTVYPGVAHLLSRVLPSLGVRVKIADADALPEAVERGAVLVYAETPANPTLALTDIGALRQAIDERAPGAVLLVKYILGAIFF